MDSGDQLGIDSSSQSSVNLVYRHESGQTQKGGKKSQKSPKLALKLTKTLMPVFSKNVPVPGKSGTDALVSCHGILRKIRTLARLV